MMGKKWLHKICNRNNVKISYSCTPNMASIISGHNKNLLNCNNTQTDITPPCNCRVKSDCPFAGACREMSIICKATIPCGNSVKHYLGSCATEFKARFYNYKQSFKYRRKMHATELSKAVWRAKDGGTPEPTIR